MRILVDVDGVVADFIGRFLQYVAAITGKRYMHEDVAQWDPAAALGLTPCQATRVWNLFSRPGIARDLFPYQDAITPVRQLQRDHEVVFVTAPLRCSLTWAHDRTTWLHRYFGNDCPIVLTHDKHLVQGDLLIDDSHQNVALYLKRNSRATALMPVRPWNASQRAALRLRFGARFAAFDTWAQAENMIAMHAAARGGAL